MSALQCRQRLVDGAAQQVLRDARSGRIDRRERFRHRLARRDDAVARMYHLRAEKALSYLAEQAQSLADGHLLDLTAVKIQEAQVEKLIAVLRLYHQLAARTIGDIGVDDLGLNLTRHARKCVAHAGDVRLVFIAHRQMQGEVPVFTQADARQFLREACGRGGLGLGGRSRALRLRRWRLDRCGL